MLFNGPASTVTFTQEANPAHYISMWSSKRWTEFTGSVLFKRKREISVIFNSRRYSDSRGFSWSDHVPIFVVNDNQMMEELADD